MYAANAKLKLKVVVVPASTIMEIKTLYCTKSINTLNQHCF